MKKLFLMMASALLLFAVGCSKYDDSALSNRVDNLENRVVKLEELCKQMNTNLSSLQTIVNALQENDWITAVTPVVKDGKEIGYTIIFAKNAPITIFHGDNGQDGESGRDGSSASGAMPQIGVKWDSDGAYYWTLDGEWLTDELGNRVRASGRDGRDGVNGTPGMNGITPRLKIEDGYWWVTYDDGMVWQQLGPASSDEGSSTHTPQLGVRMDDDGRYYWTVDGAWLTDELGNKVQADARDGAAGNNGVTPTLKIEDGWWWVSYDYGANWSQLYPMPENGGSGAGDSIFASVDTSDPDYVIFRLTSGEEFRLPRTTGKSDAVDTSLAIRFSEDDMVAMQPNSAHDVFYVIDSPLADNISIEVLSSADIRAEAIAETRATGWIHIETGGSIDRFSRVVVLVSNGVRTIMKSISFEESALRVTGGTEYTVSSIGGNIEIGIETNVQYTVSIPQDAQPWVSHTATRAMRSERAVLTIAANEGAARSTIVDLLDSDGRLWHSVRVVQTEYVNPNEIHYKTTDGEIIPFVGTGSFGTDMTILSNKYVNGEGVLLFDKPVKTIGGALKANERLTEITIPPYVTSLNSYAFYNCKQLTTVHLNEGLTSIGSSGFRGCENLKEIVLPSSMTHLYDYVFYECNNLETVKLNEGLTQIGDHAFWHCESLKEITIPSGVAEISDYAFTSCIQLETVRLNEGLTKIGQHAFEFCYTLKEIVFPSTLLEIGAFAFRYCTTLGKVLLNEGLNTLGAHAFGCCYPLEELTIPDSLERIENGTFWACKLTSLTIGSRVETIRYQAFGSISTLKIIRCKAVTPPRLDTTSHPSFDNTYNTIDVYVPAESFEAYKSSSWGYSSYFNFNIMGSNFD